MGGPLASEDYGHEEGAKITQMRDHALLTPAIEASAAGYEDGENRSCSERNAGDSFGGPIEGFLNFLS